MNYSMKKYSFLIALGMCLLVNDVYTQDQKVIDSLNAALIGKTGGERFPALYELTFQYMLNDKNKALLYIQDAENAALTSRDSLAIVKSKRVKGQILHILERPEEARRAFYEALPIAVKMQFEREQLGVEYTLGRLDLLEGEYDNALRLYFKTLELAKGLKDTEYVSLALHSIGIAYYKLKDYPKGLTYLKSSLQAHKFDPKEGFYVLANIGLCYAHLGDFFNAKYYVAKSLQDCGSDCSERSKMNIEYAYGVIAQGEKNFSTAEKHFLRSFSFARKTNNARFQLDNIYLLTEIYIQQKQFHKAKRYLLEAEKLIRANVPFNLEVIKIYHRFSELYLALHDHKKASLYQSRYIHLKDSIYNEDLTNNLMKIEAEYVERQNQTKIDAQEQVIFLKEEMIRRQQTLNVITGVLGLVILTFLLFILRNYWQKRDLNLLLEKKIRERTIEFEVSRDTLQKVNHEKDLRITRASEAITKTMNTISGLCAAGDLEISDPVGHFYIKKIEETSSQVSVYLRSFIGEELLIPTS